MNEDNHTPDASDDATPASRKGSPRASNGTLKTSAKSARSRAREFALQGLYQYIELAKAFGGTDGHKYVNAVLNGLAPKLRADEVRAQGARPSAA